MTARYTRTAQALHWTLALLLVGMVSLGLYMHELPLSPLKLQLYSYHKWAGVSVFLLVLAFSTLSCACAQRKSPA